jgi:hypothetical protein
MPSPVRPPRRTAATDDDGVGVEGTGVPGSTLAGVDIPGDAGAEGTGGNSALTAG